MTPEQIARVAYEAIRSTSPKAKPAWEEAPEKDRKTYTERVELLTADPTIEPPAKASDEEKAKAKMFSAVVLAITTTPKPAPVAVAIGQKAVKYIGHRERYGDGVAGTGLFWMKGETLMVPNAQADVLLKNHLVWVEGKTEDTTGFMPPPKPQEDPAEVENTMLEISMMDTKSLVDFAKTKYRMDVDASKPVEALRQEVAGLVDQYGVV